MSDGREQQAASEVEDTEQREPQAVEEPPAGTPPEKPPEPPEPRREAHPYLPYLTTLLLITVAAWFVKDLVFDRPSTEQQLRINSFARALELIPHQYVEDVTAEELYRAAMEGMLTRLSDDYSTYLDSLEVELSDAESSGEFGGVGITVRAEEGRVVVTEVREGSPAQRAGLETGDVIVAVDGQKCSQFSFTQVVAMVRGKAGTPVELVVRKKEGDRERTVEVTREKITLETVREEMLEPGIGLIRLARFDQDATPETKEALQKLVEEGARGLILDLRNNTGGLLEQAVGVCDLFLNEGRIVSLKSRLASEEDTYKATKATAVPKDLPLVVLVDGHTGSGAEIVAGALQSHGRATLVGTTTFGKGAVNKLYQLPDGSGILLTVAYYEIYPGRRIDGKGVEPDIKVGELSPFPSGGDRQQVKEWLEHYHSAREQQLARARELLKERIR